MQNARSDLRRASLQGSEGLVANKGLTRLIVGAWPRVPVWLLMLEVEVKRSVLAVTLGAGAVLPFVSLPLAPRGCLEGVKVLRLNYKSPTLRRPSLPVVGVLRFGSGRSR